MYLILVVSMADAEEVVCPEECQCTVDGLNFMVDCSNSNLVTLPEFTYKNVSEVNVVFM